jgi:hypothetical protein
LRAVGEQDADSSDCKTQIRAPRGRHLSYDYTREHQLAGAVHFASLVARGHAAELDSMFSVIAEGNDSLPTPPPELLTLLWTTYVHGIVRHLSDVLDADTAAGVMRQVLRAHGEQTT